MSFYFLPEDYSKLNALIGDISNRIKAIGKEMGASCEEGAETYHDNFAFEDGERQQRMWCVRLKELLEISGQAKVVQAGGTRVSTVSIGCRVTFRNLCTDEEQTIRIGSYLSFSENGTVSYDAPLARIMMGANEGDVCEGMIGGTKRELEIIRVH